MTLAQAAKDLREAIRNYDDPERVFRSPIKELGEIKLRAENLLKAMEAAEKSEPEAPKTREAAIIACHMGRWPKATTLCKHMVSMTEDCAECDLEIDRGGKGP